MLKTKVSSLAKIKYSITAGIVVVCCLITYRFTQPVDASKESELFTGATTTKDAVYNTVTVSKGTLSSAYQGQASIEYSNYKTIEVSEEFDGFTMMTLLLERGTQVKKGDVIAMVETAYNKIGLKELELR